MGNAALLLGSNLGNRYENLQRAIHLISTEGEITARSSVYETSAWGKTDQPAFLNQAIILDTLLPPEKLMFRLLHIEQSMGRARKEKWDARIIDVDILFFNSFVRDTEFLKLPHPYLSKRLFSLIPLSEIAPEWEHPLTGMNVEEMMDKCEDKGEVRIFQEIFNE